MGFNTQTWLKPLAIQQKQALESLCDKLFTSLTMARLKKEFKIQEDPWDNFLAHDAKLIIPLLRHQVSLLIVGPIVSRP